MTESGATVGAAVVHVTSAPAARYGAASVEGPELDPSAPRTTSLASLRTLFGEAGLDAARGGTAAWSPLTAFVQPGDRVVVKPNWVHHANKSGAGEDALVTHGEVIAALLEYLVAARPGSTVVGDAPVQGCDFEALRRLVGAEAMERRFGPRLPGLRIADFRRKVLARPAFGGRAAATSRRDDEYVLFDLGRDSLLEPISRDSDRFRVTMYDPRALRATHGPGRHQYLVAREVMEADVVFNVPKLKTHKKAGITAALKNVVGINGHKEYLPHHRRGGSESGGDNYAGRARTKRLAELAADGMNLASSARLRGALGFAMRGLVRLGTLLGEDGNLDGSWSGNDTVWRMTLDLDRVLLYGRPDGTLSKTPMRRVVTLTDAIVAGEGEGPLAPTPLPLGLMTLATNQAAAEVVHCHLLGLDPRRLPLVRHAFDQHTFPLAPCALGDVRLVYRGAPAELHARPWGARRARVPRGWRGACELTEGST